MIEDLLSDVKQNEKGEIVRVSGAARYHYSVKFLSRLLLHCKPVTNASTKMWIKLTEAKCCVLLMTKEFPRKVL